MVQTQDVRQNVQQYLAGEQSLRDLVDWLTETGWQLRTDAREAAALDAIRTVELHIGIFTSGRCTRDELQERLREAVNGQRAIPLTLATIEVGPDHEPRLRLGAETASGTRTQFVVALV